MYHRRTPPQNACIKFSFQSFHTWHPNCAYVLVLLHTRTYVAAIMRGLLASCYVLLATIALCQCSTYSHNKESAKSHYEEDFSSLLRDDTATNYDQEQREAAAVPKIAIRRRKLVRVCVNWLNLSCNISKGLFTFKLWVRYCRYVHTQSVEVLKTKSHTNPIIFMTLY